METTSTRTLRIVDASLNRIGEGLRLLEDLARLLLNDATLEVLDAGADSVAVISAVLQAESPEKATRQIAARFEVQK